MWSTSSTRCPAGVQGAELQIDPVKCRLHAVRAHLPGAISGTVRQPHTIDTAKCVKCGACIEVQIGAISKG